MKINEQSAYGVVVAIKEQEYKFLILLQDEEFVNWSFPKGKVEEGETVPLDIAMRELKEETEITDITILDFPLIEEKYEYEKRGEKFCRTNKYFIGIVKDKFVKIDDKEILKYKWATFDEAINTFGFNGEKRIETLKKTKEYLDKYKK
jgi:8-oxo-dGTP pyrophosphatase MutT (NUDIX family)